MGSFVPHTPDEIKAMLGFLGLDSLDDLFAHLPAALPLAAAASGRRLVWVSAGVRPAIRQVIRTLCGPRLEIREAPLAGGLTAWPDDLGEPAALLLAHPNHLGVLEDVAAAADKAHAAGALLVAGADPVAAGLLKPVGELGADAMVGEGQPLGTPLAFRGPYVGLFAVKNAPWVRRW